VKRTGAILELEVAPYGDTLYLFTDRAKFRRASKALGAPLEVEFVRRCAGLCVSSRTNILIGVFGNGLSTLVHELTHALDHIIGFNSLPPVGVNGPSNETAAFLMEYLFKKCSEALIPQTKPRTSR